MKHAQTLHALYILFVLSLGPVSAEWLIVPVPKPCPEPEPVCVEAETVLVSKVILHPESLRVHWREIGTARFEDRGRGIKVFSRGECFKQGSYYYCSDNIPVPKKGRWAIYWTYIGDMSDINCYERP